MKREWTFGACRAYFEEPDTLIVYPGPTSLEVARFLADLYRELGTQKPFFLVVVTGGDPITTEARGHLLRHTRQELYRGMLFVGVSPLGQVVAKAFIASGRFMGRWTMEVLFVSTEAEARARIAQLRKEQESPSR